MDLIKRLIELLNNARADVEKLQAAVDAFRQIDPADIERLRKASKTLVGRLDEGHKSIHGLAEASDIAGRLEAPSTAGRCPAQRPRTWRRASGRSSRRSRTRWARTRPAMSARSSRAWTSS